METNKETILAARVNRNYKLKYIADLLNIKSNTLSCYERGTKAIPLTTMLALAHIYSKTLDSFDYTNIAGASFRNHRFDKWEESLCE